MIDTGPIRTNIIVVVKTVGPRRSFSRAERLPVSVVVVLIIKFIGGCHDIRTRLATNPFFQIGIHIPTSSTLAFVIFITNGSRDRGTFHTYVVDTGTISTNGIVVVQTIGSWRSFSRAERLKVIVVVILIIKFISGCHDDRTGLATYFLPQI